MLNIRFEPELYQQLLAEAKRTGTSIPALVCQLLKTILNNEERMNKTEQFLSVDYKILKINTITNQGKSI
ncbi:Uncharacterised protein [Klebsiella pneumoniae subsp. ozaenae]|uniref:CopG-like ribbon-helix-helix domain-containing protein n=1 Tax=Klebsiella pneumoniae subsp. ozaenae TaxID=574 RepID=A0A377Z565_KLEPO|nr:Uncharacterised protein [Klebsiella pneumoniae subsp. ozaenae]